MSVMLNQSLTVQETVSQYVFPYFFVKLSICIYVNLKFILSLILLRALGQGLRIIFLISYLFIALKSPKRDKKRLDAG